MAIVIAVRTQGKFSFWFFYAIILQFFSSLYCPSAVDKLWQDLNVRAYTVIQKARFWTDIQCLYFMTPLRLQSNIQSSFNNHHQRLLPCRTSMKPRCTQSILAYHVSPIYRCSNYWPRLCILT